MHIPKRITNELKEISPGEPIKKPNLLFFVGRLSKHTMSVINTKVNNVYISRSALKHIIERRGNDEIISKIPLIISHPTKIVDNSKKRRNSFILVKMNGKASGVVIEITKTPDENRVVSAFPIDNKTYRKLEDISGRPDVPP